MNIYDKINRNRTDRKKSQFGREEEKPSARSLEVILEFISGWIPKIFGTGGGA